MFVTDFGLEVLSDRVAETKFPWLMSNEIDHETGRPLGDGKITHVIDWSGKRIGIVSIAHVNSLFNFFFQQVCVLRAGYGRYIGT
jgi:2',3'-cyclic-nucleotide 2'-phosphodiesterase (5'-nucleotidase family)